MSRISMKHFFSNIKHHTSASIGIGSLIVFIAMVLVAGIAASVLIQTSNHLESQAMYTGRETRNEISSDIDILDITGNYNTRIINDEPLSRYHNMTITVTPKSASTINLDEVIIEISNGSKLCLLSWNSSKFALGPSGSGVFSTPGLFDLEASCFGIIVEEDGDGSCIATSPSINRGDKACITVNLSACFNGLESRADVRGMIIPELGAPAVIFFRTPATNFNMVVDFF